MKRQREESFWRTLAVRIPYAWLLAFFLVPFLIVLKISLSQTTIAQPPYTPVLDLAAGWQGIEDFFAALSFDNYVLLGSDPLYLLSYLKSVEIAAFSTLILLVIGYPIAYAIARTPRRWQAVLVVLTVLPFWTSFLIRIYAWMNILERDGPLNQVLVALRIVSEPPVWLATDTAIYIGIVYSYLPFMVLPLYATLEKMDETLLEAAADLGCRRWRAFWRVTFPLSRPACSPAPAVLHPDRRRVRHSRSARRLAVADDRADDLDGILRQQGLAGGLRGRRGAGLPAGDADPRLSAPGDADGVAGLNHAQGLRLQHRRPHARHRLPLSADRRPGGLFLQCLAAGRGLGRLVDALVRGARRRRAARSIRRSSASAWRWSRRARRRCSARSRRWRSRVSAASAAGSCSPG